MSAKVYLASGWFTSTQRERRDKVLEILEFAGHEVYSPERDALIASDATEEERQSGIQRNIDEINKCDFTVCITNEKDMGTIFEAGVSYEKHVPLVYFAEGLDGPFNLMLAQSASVVSTSYEQLDDYMNDDELIEDIKKSNGGVVIPYEGHIE